MSEIKDGGPAFPHDDRAEWTERSGMTLRDFFAAKAMAALIVHDGGPDYREQTVAEMAYAAADAMLVAREQQ